MGWSKFETSIHVGDHQKHQQLAANPAAGGHRQLQRLVNFGESNFWRHSKVGIDYHRHVFIHEYDEDPRVLSNDSPYDLAETWK